VTECKLNKEKVCRCASRRPLKRGLRGGKGKRLRVGEEPNRRPFEHFAHPRVRKVMGATVRRVRLSLLHGREGGLEEGEEYLPLGHSEKVVKQGEGKRLLAK